MTTINQAKQAILESMQNGTTPNYSTIGGYETGKAAFEELQAEGKIRWAKVPSKTGKRMMNKLILC